ncbi:Thymocyte nuclear protein 1 [Erysiphe neolycopersici]|uniref:Thymocyte nuclear protein 1 n=1 Tax=Erysiphe neolycopersici TaxID=212602 RepID=A0A420HJ73_9PEZI|nr:Thymocyte nuclear protein 1 [Erysiphe neolycopersici]
MPKRKRLDLEKNESQKVNILQEKHIDVPQRLSNRLKSARAGQESSKAHNNCIPAPIQRRSHSLKPRKESGNKLEQDKRNTATTSTNEPNHKTDNQVERDSFTTQKLASHDDYRAHPIVRLRQYWLLKAEPESRLEKGVDIKFSIDDLAAKTEPEPWDGIRNYGARNNLRCMKKGDLAFFYHSSCKVPAIVGIMEIVREHTPDFSSRDPTSPYYDVKDNRMEPKWSLVHVEFRQKLKTPITLKELKAWHTEKNHVLGNMQMLKLTRMSVSKVEEVEWNFLISEMIKRGDKPSWQTQDAP